MKQRAQTLQPAFFICDSSSYNKNMYVCNLLFTLAEFKESLHIFWCFKWYIIGYTDTIKTSCQYRGNFVTTTYLYMYSTFIHVYIL